MTMYAAETSARMHCDAVDIDARIQEKRGRYCIISRATAEAAGKQNSVLAWASGKSDRVVSMMNQHLPKVVAASHEADCTRRSEDARKLAIAWGLVSQGTERSSTIQRGMKVLAIKESYGFEGVKPFDPIANPGALVFAFTCTNTEHSYIWDDQLLVRLWLAATL